MPKGKPEGLFVHDIAHLGLGKAIPYCAYHGMSLSAGNEQV